MLRRWIPVVLLIAGALAAAVAAGAAPPEAQSQTAASAAGGTTASRWKDPDGNSLPFKSDQELLEFLKTARIVKEKELSGGVTRPLKVLVEKDGVKANAVFRDVAEERTSMNFGSGYTELNFRDSYLFEPAAYELSLLLGFDNVPPVTVRKHRNSTGSIQIWVESSMTETKRQDDKIEPPDQRRWNKQVQMMNVFDELIYNTDRNKGNMLITPDWKIWMIDHTRAFRRHKTPKKPDSLKQCERGFFEKLRTLDEARVRETLKPYLKNAEIDGLLARRKVIVARLEKLIAERGEAKVLYTLEDATAVVE